jgi:hypothetical protein
MTLTSHAIAGAAVASFFPKNPIPAFIFAFLGHFILDSIRHGHYPIKSRTRHPENRLAEDMPWGRDLFFDLIKIQADLILGLILSFLLFQKPGSPINWILVLGALAGMAPDALQFVYWKIRREPFASLQRFHMWIHAEKSFDSAPVKAIAVEFGSALISIGLVKFLI